MGGPDFSKVSSFMICRAFNDQNCPLGHSATILRIFPSAAIRFMVYEELKLVSGIMPHTLLIHHTLIRFSSRPLITIHPGGILLPAHLQVIFLN